MLSKSLESKTDSVLGEWKFISYWTRPTGENKSRRKGSKKGKGKVTMPWIRRHRSSVSIHVKASVWLDTHNLNVCHTCTGKCTQVKMNFPIIINSSYLAGFWQFLSSPISLFMLHVISHLHKGIPMAVNSSSLAFSVL